MIVTVIGGRARHPSLSEIERVVAELRPGCILRHPTASAPGKMGTERLVGRYVKARGRAEIEPWPTRRAALDGLGSRPPSDLLLALDGGESTKSTIRAARKRGVPVIEIEPVAEPRIWNRHHGTPPGPSVYIGRGTPLGNPFELPHDESRAEAAPRILGQYRRWLWPKIAIDSPERDPAVVQALRALTPETFVVCSCWPDLCHGEPVVRASRLVAAGDPRVV
jgi:hypothetical protein